MGQKFYNESDIQAIASAIRVKNGLSDEYTVSQMASAIEAIPTADPPIQNPALTLVDWEGTILKEYTKEQALALTELPAPSSFSKYANIDHELLTFQEWTYNLSEVKNFINSRKNECLFIGAIYNLTDGQAHNYWNKTRLENINTAIYIRKNNGNVGAYAFDGRQILKNISLSNNTSSIGRLALRRCYSLTSINIPKNTAMSISTEVFVECYNLETVCIPYGITSLTYSMFRGCTVLKNINIPNTVTSINQAAFQNCYKLKNIILPNNLETIGISAFLNCSNLTSICIPQSVTTIEATSFGDCGNLVDVVIKGKPELVNTTAFRNNSANEIFYVSRTDLSWFETATNWSTFYANNQIVAIEDNIEYLESIGINIDEYKES